MMNLMLLTGAAMLWSIALQTPPPHCTEVSVRNLHVERRADQISVSMKIGICPARRHSLRWYYTPKIVVPGASEALSLPTLTVRASTVHWFDSDLEPDLDPTYDPDLRSELSQERVKKGRNTPYFIDYYATVPYEAWMKIARLEIEVSAVSREGKTIEAPHRQVVCVPFYVPFQPQYRLLEPSIASLEITEYALACEPDFRFSAGQTEISLKNPHNRLQLEQLIDTIKACIRPSRAFLRVILVEGFTAPEGDPTRYKAVALRRAESLKRELKRSLPLSDEQCHTEGRTIDSLRLIKLCRERGVTSDNLPALQRLIYPALRRCRCKVVYSAPDSTLCAATRQIRLAQQELQCGEIEQAYWRLNPYRDTPLCYATLGVICALRGDFEQAVIYLLSASEEGDATARYNLSQLERYLKEN